MSDGPEIAALVQTIQDAAEKLEAAVEEIAIPTPASVRAAKVAALAAGLRRAEPAPAPATQPSPPAEASPAVVAPTPNRPTGGVPINTIHPGFR